MVRKAAEFDQFQIRLPPGMRGRIKVAAEQNNRSMNAEIVATLEQAYPAPSPLMDPEYLEDQIAKVEAYLKENGPSEIAEELLQKTKSLHHSIVSYNALQKSYSVLEDGDEE